MARKAKPTRKQAIHIAKKYSPKTGDVELSRQPDSWKSFFALVRQTPVPQDFLSKHERDDRKPQQRIVF